MDPIISFTKEHRFLSSFYPCSIMWMGKTWPTVEHAYQASKNPAMAYAIKRCETPGQAKRLSRQFKPTEDWEGKKLGIMEKLVRIKFCMPRFRERLLATGDAILVEGNHWHDNFWGDCCCPDCLDVDGANHLGKILMRVRDEIRTSNSGSRNE